ncbi:enterobactin/ferric enterobactin esterase [Ruminiclostridium hungatei]|uniref:Enterobactin/ferric enterobactin esterase n=1 Tax=Ruminiclostridium hungatei TaxID=48256 RepID=A0A1V4SKQ8_RUMHU|nr:alpha/beta hydrolase-fold protein [Ruminiclostridium hungatei]OPX44478.1 enterobactin/ferric enterobactin esterase [Ruminiclostridium hungatei]
MAFLQVNYFSKALNRHVSFNALIPVDDYNTPEQEKEIRPFRSLYLLHGYTGSYMDWICGSRIQEFAMKNNLAVFMPSGDNNFYLDDTDIGALYGEFVGKELVETTRQMFRLSEKRDDTYIGGYSMGGYGAVRNGLKYSENFSRIIALSSALITRGIAGIPVDFKGPVADYPYYRRVFGDLDQLIGSDKDPEALIDELKGRKAEIPQIYMACGTEDFLLEENRQFHDFLVSRNIMHTYVEDSGVHDWNFWNTYIEKGISWIVEG